jgi:hypothetical protein
MYTPFNCDCTTAKVPGAYIIANVSASVAANVARWRLAKLLVIAIAGMEARPYNHAQFRFPMAQLDCYQKLHLIAFYRALARGSSIFDKSWLQDAIHARPSKIHRSLSAVASRFGVVPLHI